MPLYATGFNAWNQLQFRVAASDAQVAEPDDLSSFACVLPDERVRRVRAALSYTEVVLDNGETRFAGMVPVVHQQLRSADELTYTALAEAANGTVVVHDGNDSLKQYPSVHHLLSHAAPSPVVFANHPAATQTVAYAAGFAALDPPTGRVWTWGDERYAACLGREPSDDSPAAAPRLLADLVDVPTGPVAKLAASPSGYLLAALTAGGDLYCWGDAARCGPALRSLHLDENDGAPVPVVIADATDTDGGGDAEKDVADVGVGDAHVLVLTADGEVYVLGDNSNGQLGLGPGVATATEWTRVELERVLEPGERVTSVVAGPRNSFLVVEKENKAMS
ncbi:hypothetical protein VTJ83DRAFT_6811 [Remersonia thermophila]|uniref:Regulator of chromosome condensation 1/beta-lactamase-inhibitor protein II n=1 Tax=Remersonia thermophila TaxID=72144 RepID=A0ABR4D5R2_9PEZI